ncbi:hypothetical protein OAG76_01755 [Rubripirellula sp.]|nr:hypothetical protein [Rubripirellula sp.]MDB4634108.1 hypothetical protein [Rubripirellula sp.]
MPNAEKIIKHGTAVLSYFWDSGGPGAGAGVEQVFYFKEHYAVASEYEGPLGPFESLVDAIEQTTILSIGDASEKIECDSLSVTQIIDLLHMYCSGNEPVLEINGQVCKFDPKTGCYYQAIDD